MTAGGGTVDLQLFPSSGGPIEGTSDVINEASSSSSSSPPTVLRSTYPPPSSLPRMDSSAFVVRGVDGGEGRPMDMWQWNVAPWRRVCAEAKLREADRKTALPTYVDGSPKRRPREVQRMQNKGFASPDSAPNAFTLDEWRALEPSHWREYKACDPVDSALSAAPLQAHLRQVRAAIESPEGIPMCLSGECASQSFTKPDRDYTGLLDPSLFDQTGELVEGELRLAALDRLDLKERHQRVDGQQRHRRQTRRLRSEGADAEVEGDPLGGELASRDGWGWKVRPEGECSARSANRGFSR